MLPLGPSILAHAPPQSFCNFITRAFIRLELNAKGSCYSLLFAFLLFSFIFVCFAVTRHYTIFSIIHASISDLLYVSQSHCDLGFVLPLLLVSDDKKKRTAAQFFEFLMKIDLNNNKLLFLNVQFTQNLNRTNFTTIH